MTVCATNVRKRHSWQFKPLDASTRDDHGYQFEEGKDKLRDEMVQKTNLLVFQLDRQEQYIRRENILIYGVAENKEDNDDGENVLFKIADELKIDLEDNEIQSTSTRTKEKK